MTVSALTRSESGLLPRVAMSCDADPPWNHPFCSFPAAPIVLVRTP